jgi:putative hydrolase of the HAD superfamily
MQRASTNLQFEISGSAQRLGERLQSASKQLFVEAALMASTYEAKSIKAIFFDAVGTLFELTKTVGDHYAYVGREIGLDLDAQSLDRVFHAVWKQMPQRGAIDGPRENDDKFWWRELVDLVLDQVAPSLSEFDRDNFFEVAYEHFAEPDVWELYPEVRGVLEELEPRFKLAVISNFDGRLRLILRHLSISKFFTNIFVSSELGADKPDPEIYRRALKLMNLKPNEVLHVGDDSQRDWQAATAAGLQVFQLKRPETSLRDLLTILQL